MLAALLLLPLFAVRICFWYCCGIVDVRNVRTGDISHMIALGTIDMFLLAKISDADGLPLDNSKSHSGSLSCVIEMFICH